MDRFRWRSSQDRQIGVHPTKVCLPKHRLLVGLLAPLRSRPRRYEQRKASARMGHRERPLKGCRRLRQKASAAAPEAYTQRTYSSMARACSTQSSRCPTLQLPEKARGWSSVRHLAVILQVLQAPGQYLTQKVTSPMIRGTESLNLSVAASSKTTTILKRDSRKVNRGESLRATRSRLRIHSRGSLIQTPSGIT